MERERVSMLDQVLDWLYRVLVSPAEAFRELSGEKPVGPAVIIILMVAALTSVGSSTVAQETLGIEVARVWMVLVAAVSTFIGSLVMVAVLFAVSALLGASGDFAGLLSAVGFAQFPGLFNLPADLLSRLPGVGPIGGLMSFGVGIWTLVLGVIALRESRGLSTGMSIVTYLVTIVAFVFVVAVAVVAALMPML